MSSLYIHIPLCASRCSYCDFYSTTLTGRSASLCAALRGEMEQRADFLGGETVETIYFGGGTPSLLPAQEIGAIIDRAKELFDCQITEATMEANPDDLTQEYLDAIAKTDINRLSIGIQSFDDESLRLLNRRHSAAEAIEAVGRARTAGFKNITIDLMFGIAPMSRNALIYSINQAIALDVEHISAYHLTIEQGTALHRMGMEAVDEQRSEDEFNLVHTMLTEAGYEHYEVSNFAKKGFRARHNSGYWNGTRYLGIGPSAHSYNGEQRFWADADLASYIANGVTLTQESLSTEEKYNEYVMTRLRRSDGIELTELKNIFGEAFCTHFLNCSTNSLQNNNLVLCKGVYSIPPVRFLLSDAVISELFI